MTQPHPLRRLGPLTRAGVPIHRQLLVVVLALLVAMGTIGLLLALFMGGASHFSDFSISRNYRYSQDLGAMGEPVLRAGRARSYRFLWVPSFHEPVAIRIESTGGTHLLVAVELDRRTSDGARPIRRRKEMDLSAEQFARIERLFDDNRFWSMPATEASEGLDGARWVVEGATDRYHAIDRFSPASGPVRTIGTEMLALTGWALESELY